MIFKPSFCIIRVTLVYQCFVMLFSQTTHYAAQALPNNVIVAMQICTHKLCCPLYECMLTVRHICTCLQTLFPSSCLCIVRHACFVYKFCLPLHANALSGMLILSHKFYLSALSIRVVIQDGIAHI
jgi:hypothetical protein